MGTLFFIKAGHFSPKPGQNIIKASEYSLLVEAENIIQKAHEESNAVALAAKLAYEKEKERGYAEGLAEGKMEMAERMMETAIKGVDYLEGLEGTIIDLVMSAMSKVIEGFDSKERVISVVRKALGYVRSQKRVVLRLCPEDAEIVQAELSALQRDFPSIGILDMSADPRLAKGSCILESELGIINASLEVQLEGIRKAFSRQLRQGPGESL